jgi:hypothetical protein
LKGLSSLCRQEGLATLIADSSRRRRALYDKKMDVAGRVGRSDPKGMPQSPFHTCLLTEDRQSQSLLQMKRKSEAPQSECKFEDIKDEGSLA